MDMKYKLLYLFIEHFHTDLRDTKDNRHSGHVGVPNKNNQNSFFESIATCMAAVTSGENALIDTKFSKTIF